ncbi:MAG: Hpt domain-containing protein [Nitrososphaerales archaeon]
MSENSDIYKEYKKEAKEILNTMRSLCESLKERSDKYPLTEIVQCSHKIKGVAGMMDYSAIAELANEIESVSKLLVDEKLQLKPEIVTVLSESISVLAKYVETDYNERDVRLLEKLRKLSGI